jgi:hypothetical protein
VLIRPVGEVSEITCTNLYQVPGAAAAEHKATTASPSWQEYNRATLNQWIRTSGVFDAVIDFDAVMRDPQNPTSLLPQYDNGDHLHPNSGQFRRGGRDGHPPRGDTKRWPTLSILLCSKIAARGRTD